MKDTNIDLPESTETDPVTMDTEEIVFVGVMPNGTFLIEDETVQVSSIDALRDHLYRERRRVGLAPIKVRIRSSRDAPVRHAFEVAALCDELGLSKSLEVELEALN